MYFYISTEHFVETDMKQQALYETILFCLI